MKYKIPFHKSSIGREEIEEVVKTLKSGWLTTGPKTHEFEEDFKKYIGCRYAIGLNSCTAGLHIALETLEVGKGDEVITSPVTFPATANVIVHQGAKPVFADIDISSLTIESSNIEKYISKKTKAIIPVHFAGYPSDMDKIMKISKQKGIFVIEDAAHAIETSYKGKKIGTIGDFAAFSFYATKNITTGEGGMLVCNNKKYAEKSRVLSLHGISNDAWKRQKNIYKYWELMLPGYKYNMYDIQASIGIHQLKKVEIFLKRREKIVKKYDKAFSGIPEITTIKKDGDIKHAYHLYVVILKLEDLKANREEIMVYLQSKGIEVSVHFRTLHLQPYYKKRFGYKKGMLPNAEYVSDRVLSLPLFPGMKISQVDYVTNHLIKAIEKFRK